MQIIKSLGISFFVIAIISACSSNTEYVPKPKGFQRIDLPKYEYIQLTEKHPYTFKYSKNAIILKDTNGLVEPHWIHVYYPQFKATIDITYKALGVNSGNDFKKLINDANKLTAKHQIKASSIEEMVVLRPEDKRKSYLYMLQGEVPSPYQFHITDSTKHFLSGALYFDTATQNDSLDPVIRYLKQDVIMMMNSVEWK